MTHMSQKRRQARGWPVVACFALAVLTAVASDAQGVPLTEAACERYAAERSILRRLGVESHLDREPEWARENLTAPQLDLIQRYIKLDEALKFRCPAQYATLVVEAPQQPRRLDVTPPPPARRPVVEAARGVTEKQPPPPQPADRKAREQS